MACVLRGMPAPSLLRPLCITSLRLPACHLCTAVFYIADMTMGFHTGFIVQAGCKGKGWCLRASRLPHPLSPSRRACPYTSRSSRLHATRDAARLCSVHSSAALHETGGSQAYMCPALAAPAVRRAARPDHGGALRDTLHLVQGQQPSTVTGALGQQSRPAGAAG